MMDLPGPSLGWSPYEQNKSLFRLSRRFFHSIEQVHHAKFENKKKVNMFKLYNQIPNSACRLTHEKCDLQWILIDHLPGIQIVHIRIKQDPPVLVVVLILAGVMALFVRSEKKNCAQCFLKFIIDPGLEATLSCRVQNQGSHTSKRM